MRALLIALLLVLASGAEAQAPADSLAGSWTVDLRPTPEAEVYAVPFVVTGAAEDGSFTGTFYGSAIREARTNGDWGDLRFAFVTSDESTTYHTSGVLHEDGTLSGTTHALGRGFLSVWTATRDDD